ncbi:hypothetical protein HPB48_026001 [Haemaphysalis longicornis]|uniref:F-box domain-containing protein n=1 Tax=Haemaphysalis longicornis TaxID=44386 RepID=A0A9J6HAB5_HAELO|nr:hypothetical protein HPB48_026001 [Haemaphysalis longicornis]
MELKELPTELVLKIFSYLPQRSLLALAQVSAEIKRMALDPFLWTEVMIDSSLSTCPELWSDVFNSATLIRKLDASGDGVDLEALATASITLDRLEELTLTGAMLLNAAMPRLLGRCRSLTSIVLRGENVLTTKGVTILRELPGLKSLLLSFFIRVPEKVLQEICVSCPALEMLKLCSTSILNDGTWNFLGRLQHLTSLSVTVINTNGLLHIATSCPNLQSLEVCVMWNKNGVSAAQAVQELRKLRALKVRRCCVQGLFHPNFSPPTSLEYFDVPELSMDKGQMKILIENCLALRKVTFSVYKIEDSALEALLVCTHLESISLSGLRCDTLTLEVLCRFPKLAYANLDIVGAATTVFNQLQSIVDDVSTNRRSSTRLVISILPLPWSPCDALAREFGAFQNFLAVKGGQSRQDVRGMKKRTLHPPVPFSKLDKSVATASKTLKCLVLNLHHWESGE